jgi:hypothetical protein
MSLPELWIGVIEVRPCSRAPDAVAGAFTNIVTWACDVEGFRKKAETVAATMDMYVAGIEWAEPLAERARKRTFTEEVDDMVLRAESNPNAIVYGTFHTYRFDDA